MSQMSVSWCDKGQGTKAWSSGLYMAVNMEVEEEMGDRMDPSLVSPVLGAESHGVFKHSKLEQ